MALTDSVGDIIDRYAYDPFGNELSGAYDTGQLFGFTGRKYDPETGLYYYRARYYSPDMGRFLQTDPVGYDDQYNLYTYVGNDPLNKTDPTGRQETCLTTPSKFGCEVHYSDGSGSEVKNVGQDQDTPTFDRSRRGSRKPFFLNDPDHDFQNGVKQGEESARTDGYYGSDSTTQADAYSSYSASGSDIVATVRRVDPEGTKALDKMALAAASPALLLILPEVAATEAGVVVGNGIWRGSQGLKAWLRGPQSKGFQQGGRRLEARLEPNGSIALYENGVRVTATIAETNEAAAGVGAAAETAAWIRLLLGL